MDVNKIALAESVSAAIPIAGSRWKARILEANRWGSSAYYPKEVIDRDGPTIFKAGLHMYQNHLSETEQFDRPEGSVENLVGTLVTDAWVEEDGLYAEVEFYESYAKRISEIHRDIGLSVRASGLTEEAEMDGRYGPVVIGLLHADSVDVVTKAGAGGKLTSIIESDRNPAGRPIVAQEGTSVTDVTKEDFEAFATELREAISAIPAALAEALKPVPVEGQEELTESKKIEPVVDEIDNAAVLTAVAEAELPATVFNAVIADLKAGTPLVEAVKKQADYRDSLLEGKTVQTGVVIRESASDKPTGLARAVALLGK